MPNDDLDKQTLAQEILSLLGSQDEGDRSHFMSGVGRIGAPNLMPLLCDELFDPLVKILLDETNELKRADAAILLGHSENKTAVPYLLQVLNPISGQWLQCGAIIALGQLGDTSAIPKLSFILTATLDTSQIMRFVRPHVALALGKIGDKAALPALLEAIDSLWEAELLAQRFAVDAIGHLTDKNAAVDALIGLLSHNVAYIRGFAATNLGFLTTNSDDLVLRSKVTHKLIDALVDQGESKGYWQTVAGDAVRSLTFINDPEGNAAIEKWREQINRDAADLK
ncbi:MAG: HEAT repeat domain-containing protein [Chloroflexota bacterium]